MKCRIYSHEAGASLILTTCTRMIVTSIDTKQVFVSFFSFYLLLLLLSFFLSFFFDRNISDIISFKRYADSRKINRSNCNGTREVDSTFFDLFSYAFSLLYFSFRFFSFFLLHARPFLKSGYIKSLV